MSFMNLPITVHLLHMLKKHKDELQRNGYVALHDRSGHVMEKLECNDMSLWEEVDDDLSGPAPGSVDPSASMDENLYEESSDGDTSVDSGSVDPTAPNRPNEVE